MATKPILQSSLDDRKDGIKIYTIDSLPAATESDAIDVRGAATVWAISDVALTWRMYDTVLNDGTSYLIVAGEDVVDGGVSTTGHINNPPPVITVKRAGASPGDVYIVIIYDRRRVIGGSHKG